MEGKDDGRDDASIPPSPMPPASAMATPPSRASSASAQSWRSLDGVRCTGIEAQDLPSGRSVYVYA